MYHIPNLGIVKTVALSLNMCVYIYGKFQILNL